MATAPQLALNQTVGRPLAVRTLDPETYLRAIDTKISSCRAAKVRPALGNLLWLCPSEHQSGRLLTGRRSEWIALSSSGG